MIVSIGIDIVEVYRIRETLERTPRFTERVFTEKERAYCDAKGAASAQSYAARFAAKEAFLKALKTGWRGKITWQDMEILNDTQGVPSLEIKGEARKLLENLGANKIHLSISHTTDHAVAQVVVVAALARRERREDATFGRVARVFGTRVVVVAGQRRTR